MNGIVGDVLTAYNYFGTRGALKKFEMLQPVMRIASSLSPAMEVVTDFKDRVPTSVPTTLTLTGSGTWDAGLWNQAKWSASTEVRDSWTGVTGIGYCGAVRIRISPDPLRYTDLAVSEDDLLSYDGSGIVAASAARTTNAAVELVAFNLKYENQTGGQL